VSPRSLSIFGISAILLGGCATCLDGSRQKIDFDSNPAGAEVVVNGSVLGQTPMAKEIDRGGDPLTVLFRKEGYNDSTRTLTVRTNPNYWMNAVWIYFAFFASSTDSSTGAKNEYSPSQLVAFLESKTPRALTPIGDSGIDKTTKINRYIIANYALLSVDIANGTGERLKGLLELLSIKDFAERRKATERLLEIYIERPTAAEFSDAVMREFMK
jgi:hypothetical protein